jgi:small subunit ribosomal protein S3
MGQKIHPTGYRIGVTLPWVSRWSAAKGDFGKLILEDAKIRKLLKKNYDFAGISQIDIERSGEEITVVVSTARPGLLIGRKGKKLDELKEDVERVLRRKLNVKVNINEIGRPELDARIVGQSIREQLEKRMPFRRVLKKTLQATMQAGADGVKIRMAGRLGGAEMARVEIAGVGRVPLTTLDADISYALSEASTTYGQIGIKVWINRGSFKKQQLATTA